MKIIGTWITSTLRVTAVSLISLYQWLISPLMHSVACGGGCRFPVSCSENFKRQIHRHGLITGTLIGWQQLRECHPWSKRIYQPDYRYD